MLGEERVSKAFRPPKEVPMAVLSIIGVASTFRKSNSDWDRRSILSSGNRRATSFTEPSRFREEVVSR